jgi:hypothetical protein
MYSDVIVSVVVKVRMRVIELAACPRGLTIPFKTLLWFVFTYSTRSEMSEEDDGMNDTLADIEPTLMMQDGRG